MTLTSRAILAALLARGPRSAAAAAAAAAAAWRAPTTRGLVTQLYTTLCTKFALETVWKQFENRDRDEVEAMRSQQLYTRLFGARR